jgi:hypothetical protein
MIYLSFLVLLFFQLRLGSQNERFPWKSSTNVFSALLFSLCPHSYDPSDMVEDDFGLLLKKYPTQFSRFLGCVRAMSLVSLTLVNLTYLVEELRIFQHLTRSCTAAAGSPHPSKPPLPPTESELLFCWSDVLFVLGWIKYGCRSHICLDV